MIHSRGKSSIRTLAVMFETYMLHNVHYIKILNISFNVNSSVREREGKEEVTFECNRPRLQFALTELIYYLEYFCILKGSCNNCKPDSVWFMEYGSMKYISVPEFSKAASCGGCGNKRILFSIFLSGNTFYPNHLG